MHYQNEPLVRRAWCKISNFCSSRQSSRCDDFVRFAQKQPGSSKSVVPLPNPPIIPTLMSTSLSILIVGCGYLGHRLGTTWRATGAPIVGVTRSPGSAEQLVSEGWKARALDIADPAACAQLAAEFPEFKVIVHCAASGRGGGEAAYQAVYFEGCQNLLQAWPTAKLFFTSSTSVYPQIDGSILTEESEAEPRSSTGKILRATESLVLAAGGTVLRLGGLYGPGRSVLLKTFLIGGATIDVRSEPPWTPYGRWVNQIHQQDAVGALQHLVALDSALTNGKCFNGTDSRPLSQREIYTYLCGKFHREMPPESAPDEHRKRGWSHKRVSNARLRGTGWTPQFHDYFSALENDPELVPSILAQLPPN